jgi:hypothetical protein
MLCKRPYTVDGRSDAGAHEALALGISDSIVMGLVLMTLANTEVSA